MMWIIYSVSEINGITNRYMIYELGNREGIKATLTKISKAHG